MTAATSTSRLEARISTDLHATDQEGFARALQSPPRATPALRRAFTRRRKLFAVD
ncbi:MAG: DUF1778 domain-containing protein [Burkholderiaceae bacterium]